ncbi:MAG: histidine kinase [Yoonia sp.]|nr:histidine kinase [Yoonia sp.]
MIARIAIVGLFITALVAGAAMYYLQVYAYYDDVSAQIEDVQLVSVLTGEPEGILFENLTAIDSDSSPLRFRACFTTGLSQALLTDTYVISDDAEPRVAPGWFDCFDAEQIGEDLSTGIAVGFMGQENIQYGIDRVIAVYPDGRAYAWHQINFCGEVVFDGNPVPPECPPAPERLQ